MHRIPDWDVDAFRPQRHPLLLRSVLVFPALFTILLELMVIRASADAPVTSKARAIWCWCRKTGAVESRDVLPGLSGAGADRADRVPVPGRARLVDRRGADRPGPVGPPRRTIAAGESVGAITAPPRRAAGTGADHRSRGQRGRIRRRGAGLHREPARPAHETATTASARSASTGSRWSGVRAATRAGTRGSTTGGSWHTPSGSR